MIKGLEEVGKDHLFQKNGIKRIRVKPIGSKGH